tara:strand:+ start:2058 stop:5075 length:3018 start_codon:yes stop_codon:yes gene_type:complete
MTRRTKIFLTLSVAAIAAGAFAVPYMHGGSEESPVVQGIEKIYQISTASTIRDVEGFFLKAESHKNPSERLKLWLELYKDEGALEKVDTATGISKSLIAHNILRDYLLSRQYSLAQTFAADNFVDTQLAWSYISILKRVSAEKEGVDLPYYFYNALDAAKNIDDEQSRERLFYALAILLTEVKNDKAVYEPVLARKSFELMGALTNPRHIQHVLKLIASYNKMSVISPSPAYKEFLAFIARDDVNAEDLLSEHERYVEKDEFDLAFLSLLAIKGKKSRTNALYSFYRELIETQQYSRAVRVALKTDSELKRLNMLSALAAQAYEAGHHKQSKELYARAQQALSQVDDSAKNAKAEAMITKRLEKAKQAFERRSDNHREKSLREGVFKLFNEKGIEAATSQAREIRDPIYRAKTYRLLAEKQLRTIDAYKIFSSQTQMDDRYIYHPAYNKKNDITNNDSAKFDAQVKKERSDNSLAIASLALPKSELGHILPVFDIHDAMEMTSQKVTANIPFASGAKISVIHYETSPYNTKFSSAIGNAGFTDKQDSIAPVLIYIQDGIADISMVYDSLRAQGLDDYITRDGMNYLIRRPIFVDHGATFILSGHEIEELKLSQESGAFLVNAGEMYIADIKLSSWSEKNKQLAYMKGNSKKRVFRPYITGWSASKTFIAGSELSGLGYSNAKSYGLSLTWGPKQLKELDKKRAAHRPTGIIVDNSFYNAYYGFYSYEADDVIVVGNEYKDNVIYGIDPHDRSERLIFGYNTAYDSQKKHGIIISREVNDSFLVGNISFDNKGTGLMIDRESINTMIYGNTAFGNKQDGLTLFESDCNIIASNHLLNNKKAGVRIRNSIDLGMFYNHVEGNKKAGVAAYTVDLLSNAAQETRDFDLDPFHEVGAASIVGNTFTQNGTGIYAEPINSLLIKENKFIEQSPRLARGDWFRNNPDLLFRFDTGVLIKQKCPSFEEDSRYHRCAIRSKGVFRGDGQSHLLEHMKASACTNENSNQNGEPL